MALPPVRLLRPSALKIDADAPCVLEMHVPVTVPHRLDPSLPAPPYRLDSVTSDELLYLHAMPVLRRLMAGIASQMLGPEHAVTSLEAPIQAIPNPVAAKLRLLAEFDASDVANKEDGFDLATGCWKDSRGIEHRESIDAYEEDPLSGEIVILQGFMISLVRGVRDAKQLKEMNPRAFRFDFVEEEEGGGVLADELVFEVGEYTEYFRQHYINTSLMMEIGDWTATPRHRL
jgi:hypothetical protein